ncbi:nucleotide-binding universal stress UspA family protein [Actinocorallia herbida]|uniref:Nucleotide-binding universal stress UspA family protein n=1 Tax=Actinocorallia herbida TaxID=58109 RepID=A0A3N1CS96_9ACTN|nr:universal stress protein [Actinocorallia herbida]ROO84173.1 nucleotide-binding universal stress UspA family protein [Actinocorallia herbida]
MPAERVLVGYVDDRRGADAVALAACAASEPGTELVLGHIRIDAWPDVPGPGNVDAEWERFLDDQAREVLAHGARRAEECGVEPAEQRVFTRRGSGRGLAALAGKVKARVVVIGSAPGGPRTGISLGSTADQLLHGSSVPVMIAPKGFADRGVRTFDRVTCAYLRVPESTPAVAAAAAIAARRKIPLRLLTFAVDSPVRGKGSAVLAEQQLRRLVDALETDLAAAAKEAAAGSTLTKRDVITQVAEGRDAAHAVHAAGWTEGDLLVCASSTSGPLRRVFMGDMSMKILRTIPCPAMVLPRTIK